MLGNSSDKTQLFYLMLQVLALFCGSRTLCNFIIVNRYTPLGKVRCNLNVCRIKALIFSILFSALSSVEIEVLMCCCVA